MAVPDEFIQSATTIYDLNDRILQEVFAHLSLDNLVAVADVNANFRWNARAVVSTRYQNEQLYVSTWHNRIWIGSEGIESPPTWPLRKPAIFRKFGETINALRMDRESLDETTRLIHEYCGESLNTLILTDSEFTAGDMLKIQRLLPRFTSLKLYKCSWESGTASVMTEEQLKQSEVCLKQVRS